MRKILNKTFRICLIQLCICLIFALSGCGSDSRKNSETTSSNKKAGGATSGNIKKKSSKKSSEEEKNTTDSDNPLICESAYDDGKMSSDTDTNSGNNSGLGDSVGNNGNSGNNSNTSGDDINTFTDGNSGNGGGNVFRSDGKRISDGKTFTDGNSGNRGGNTSGNTTLTPSSQHGGIFPAQNETTGTYSSPTTAAHGSTNNQNTTTTSPAKQTPAGEKNTTRIQSPTIPSQESKKITVTMEIKCNLVLGNPNLSTGASIPDNGIFLNNTTITTDENATVFDAFEKVCSANNIQYEYSGSATRKTVYISSICGLSYKECGTYSGWKYKVNGDVPPVGCSMYKLKDGDTISWYYSINVTD